VPLALLSLHSRYSCAVRGVEKKMGGHNGNVPAHLFAGAAAYQVNGA
jgi:hypothetical protein